MPRQNLDEQIERLNESIAEMRSSLAAAGASADRIAAALRRITNVIAQDGHNFHQGTELGRALNDAQRVLRERGEAQE